MKKKQKECRTFQTMTYRQVQRFNADRRSQLSASDNQQLKRDGYINVGWENVINLYRKLEDILKINQLEDLSLEELFLEAERIGNKYQTTGETNEFNQQLAHEADLINQKIDSLYPDTEIEVIDFSQQGTKGKYSLSREKFLKNHYRNIYL